MYIYSVWFIVIIASGITIAKQIPLHKTTTTANENNNNNIELRHETYDNQFGSSSSSSGNSDVTDAFARKRREVSDWFIAPNTRWCGRGNLANGTYNHLGGASLADKCCRRHDHCKLYIPAMSNRYELFNYRPYTLSHCTCDRRFRTCLKMANDEDANTIGKLFFNMVQTQCFVLKAENVCQQRASSSASSSSSNAKQGDDDNNNNNNDNNKCLRTVLRQKAYLKNNKKF